MERGAVTEAEIMDVLLGEAEAALEARVRQAVRHDPRAAALYAQWSRVIPAVQRGAEPLKAMNARVSGRVMARIARGPVCEPQYFISEAELDGPPRGRARLSRRAVALAVAALLLAGVAGPAAWKLMHPALTAAAVTGELVAMLPDGTGARPLRAGERLALPARLKAAPGARGELRLDGGARLNVVGGGEVVIDGRRRVRQLAGGASYEVAHAWFARNFTVHLAQGAVEDLGTAFSVRVQGERGAAIRVEQGRVRVSPANGPSAEARQGERALLDAQGVCVAPLPRWTDLAQARRSHPTRLARSVTPESEPLAPPPGAREVNYRSGDLELKAWLGASPARGERRPAVVYLHGGLSLAAKDWDDAAPFREAGYVVLLPALRGVNGNPGAFELFWGEVDDAVAAGRALAADPGVDSKRIYLAGSGAGGTLALLAAMVPSPYARVASIGGMADPAPLLDSPGLAPFNPHDPLERLLRTPAAFPDSLRKPLALLVGAEDSALAASGGQLAREAALLGKDCQLLTVEGGLDGAPEAGVRRCLELFAPPPAAP